MLNRKKFLQNLFSVTTGSVLLGFKGFEKIIQSADSNSVIPILISFDLHCHPGRFQAKGMNDYLGDESVIETVNEMNKVHLSGAFFSLVVDRIATNRGSAGTRTGREFNPGEAWQEYKRQLRNLKELFKLIDAKPATQLNDLKNTEETVSVAAFIACEGGDFLEGDLARIEQIYQDGVRSLQLVHYNLNELGDLQTEDPIFDGLSKFGGEVVRKLNTQGMVIDVAHASYETVKDVADITNAPVILSHSILKMDKDRPIAVRAITEDHAKVVAQTGGVIGAWPSGFNKDFDEYVDNTMRLVDLVGIDHVGLGSDMDANFKPVLGNYLQLPQWIDGLKSKGLSENEVYKLAGGNAVRVLSEVLK